MIILHVFCSAAEIFFSHLKGRFYLIFFLLYRIMCLAIPAKILSIEGSQALADFDGTQKNIVIALVPSVQAGQYVIVHAGMAIEIVNEQAAQESLKIWKEMLEKDLVRKEDYV